MPRSIDTRLDFLSPVYLVPGLGAKRAAALHESGIDTIGDLLYYFPSRYIDRSKITPIADLHGHLDSTRTVVGTITRTRMERGGKARLRAQITDDTGSMEALWFHGVPFFRKTLHTGMRVACTGAIKHFGPSEMITPDTSLQMVHPMLEKMGENQQRPDYPYLPHYPVTAAMTEAFLQQKTLFKAMLWVLDNLKHYPQALPQSIESIKRFPPLARCLREMHVPSSPGDLERFRARIIYEELYRIAVSLHLSKRKFAQPGRRLSAGALVEAFKRILPFTLTEEQDKAVAVLLADARSDRRMHRLLQGDVGSGKTVVAFCACLPALNEGMQVAWLVPTEVLARQAFLLLSQWCEKLHVPIELLKGSVQSEKKRAIMSGLQGNRVQFLVGTHALLQPAVTFKNLGMIVIDEQHKFGAQQRLALQEKDPRADFLLMSATPIPQTLAKTLYGDLDIVSIKGLPKGRLPVSTHCVPSHKRSDMETFVRNQILKKNAQVFYIVPRIVKNDDEGPDVKDAVSVLDSLVHGAFSDVACGLIHGQTDLMERKRVMDDFNRGMIKVLVSTTIIEVGIDAPAATVMVIENAERFGLSQLHQLRGRVGRSSEKAYCFLLANKTGNFLARQRLDYFCTHHDGFEIAEMDLRMRGPGEAAGLMQTGWDDLKMADIVRDAPVFREILESVEAGLKHAR
jgi:ATP-dependent DNA helicase RecG